MPKMIKSPVHITELHDVQTALKDKNYQTVVKRIIRILDTVMNPREQIVTTDRGQGRMTRNNPIMHDVNESQQSDYVRCLEEIKKECECITEDKVKANARSATMISGQTVLVLVNLLLEIFSSFTGGKTLETKAADDPFKQPEPPKQDKIF